MIVPMQPLRRRNRYSRRRAAAPGERRSFRMGAPIAEFRHYEAILACRQSTQINDATWERYLASDDFAAWHLVDLLRS